MATLYSKTAEENELIYIRKFRNDPNISPVSSSSFTIDTVSSSTDEADILRASIILPPRERKQPGFNVPLLSQCSNIKEAVSHESHHHSDSERKDVQHACRICARSKSREETTLVIPPKPQPPVNSTPFGILTDLFVPKFRKDEPLERSVKSSDCSQHLQTMESPSLLSALSLSFPKPSEINPSENSMQNGVVPNDPLNHNVCKVASFSKDSFRERAALHEVLTVTSYSSIIESAKKAGKNDAMASPLHEKRSTDNIENSNSVLHSKRTNRYTTPNFPATNQPVNNQIILQNPSIKALHEVLMKILMLSQSVPPSVENSASNQVVVHDSSLEAVCNLLTKILLQGKRDLKQTKKESQPSGEPKQNQVVVQTSSLRALHEALMRIVRRAKQHQSNGGSFEPIRKSYLTSGLANKSWDENAVCDELDVEIRRLPPAIFRTLEILARHLITQDNATSTGKDGTEHVKIPNNSQNQSRFGIADGEALWNSDSDYYDLDINELVQQLESLAGSGEMSSVLDPADALWEDIHGYCCCGLIENNPCYKSKP